MLKKGSDLPLLQRYIADVVKYRGFNEDLVREYVLFSEETGELAKEIRKVWERQDSLIKEGKTPPQALACALKENRSLLQGELADCLLYILNLANMLKVDLQTAVIKKEKENAKRTW